MQVVLLTLRLNHILSNVITPAHMLEQLCTRPEPGETPPVGYVGLKPVSHRSISAD